MRTLVYVHRSRSAEATALVARLHKGDDVALYRDTRGFSGGIEKCDRVVTDDPRVAEAHRKAGIEVVPFAKPAPVVVPKDIPEPVTRTFAEVTTADTATVTKATVAPDTKPSAGYRVEKHGQWHVCIGPDGKKVGAAQRSEAAARALIPEG